MNLGRPDLPELEAGALYQHSDTDATVEFLGVACLPELHGEDVAVFRFVDGGGCLIGTVQSYGQGERFQPLGDAFADEFDDESPT